MINSVSDQLVLLKKITGQNVSREKLDILNEYADILLKWNQKINLVSKKINLEELWQRHILDSALLIKYIADEKNEIIDFGSGAGFPGLVLTIIGSYKITLVESDQRKSAFLNEIITKFKLRANVITDRIEAVKPLHCDVITARALSSLTQLLDYSYPFLKKDNFMLFLKGQNVVEEIKEASKSWEFKHDFFPSELNNQGGILKISNVRRL